MGSKGKVCVWGGGGGGRWRKWCYLVCCQLCAQQLREIAARGAAAHAGQGRRREEKEEEKGEGGKMRYGNFMHVDSIVCVGSGTIEYPSCEQFTTRKLQFWGRHECLLKMSWRI